MSELDSMYKEIILEHHKDPRNFGPLEDATVKHEGFNPLCGDRVVLEIKMGAGGVTSVVQVNFHGEGCSICMSSASIMTEEMRQVSVEQAQAAIQDFRDLMGGKREPDEESTRDVEALAGVRRFPVRIKCALLPWTTLKEALEGRISAPSNTEKENG